MGSSSRDPLLKDDNPMRAICRVTNETGIITKETLCELANHHPPIFNRCLNGAKIAPTEGHVSKHLTAIGGPKVTFKLIKIEAAQSAFCRYGRSNTNWKVLVSSVIRASYIPSPIITQPKVI